MTDEEEPSAAEVPSAPIPENAGDPIDPNPSNPATPGKAGKGAKPKPKPKK